ncbi:MAG TPA: NAD(+) diphosphatase [Thermodesulfobacteriota bacterium]|nr:NAD(+) diphosphatase [Thermodesulfobacteriota bacterium]
MIHKEKFISGVVPPTERSEPAWWLVFRESNLLVYQEPSPAGPPYLIDLEELGLTALSEHYLGRLDDRPCYAAEVAEQTNPPAGMTFEGLRQMYGRLDENLFWIAARAVQIVDWDRTHRFCGRCGVPLNTKTTERAKECPQCGLLHFPRLAPAIIVLVERGNKLLLARSRHFMPGMYSVLAGFVEPGESLEEAVAREVREEVGIEVKDITYFGNQPWPFPHSLMIGFTATYAGGEISLNDDEIENAGWFEVDHLPRIPGKISIARKLIDWFVEKCGKGLDRTPPIPPTPLY